jgi:hypothetical protein
MPVSATSDKDILRVSFPVEGETPADYEAEVICFLRVTDAGLEISYSHHFIRTRESTVGPFSKEVERRMSLTPALTCLIHEGVLHEFWSTFAKSVKVSQAGIGRLPTDIREPM